MTYNDSNFLIETIVPEGEVIISRTDLKGVITYANETFADISGYSVDELIGKSHNILRHPDMPRAAFEHMWQTLKSGKMWQGYVKNMRKDGGYYWVFAEVSGVYKDDELVEYKSMRTPVPKETVTKMQRKYDEMKLKNKDMIRVVKYIPFEEYVELQ
ncbi:PAS domain-containing protein [Arcobacter sp. FWKO B]|uniref:PAS domain-containing protein n=1 Tax=Arcobacter sp. FWKO B TaxID=2593672 RepID=UPI0018A512B3|nr:PAS domain-containing protein [Arcobacter sp. FWKO B]QOG11906.1 PAS domain S-box protein [Arcobacter sp. FWKO B]